MVPDQIIRMTETRSNDKQSPRRNHTTAFKAKVALAALPGNKTLVEVATQFYFCSLVRS